MVVNITFVMYFSAIMHFTINDCKSAKCVFVDSLYFITVPHISIKIYISMEDLHIKYNVTLLFQRFFKF